MFRKRWWIMPKASFFKTFWNNLIIVLAIYNSFSTPLTIAFPEVRDYWKEKPEIVLAELIIDSTYAIDILFGFITTYFDTNMGEEIW